MTDPWRIKTFVDLTSDDTPTKWIFPFTCALHWLAFVSVSFLTILNPCAPFLFPLQLSIVNFNEQIHGVYLSSLYLSLCLSLSHMFIKTHTICDTIFQPWLSTIFTDEILPLIKTTHLLFNIDLWRKQLEFDILFPCPFAVISAVYMWQLTMKPIVNVEMTASCNASQEEEIRGEISGSIFISQKIGRDFETLEKQKFMNCCDVLDKQHNKK